MVVNEGSFNVLDWIKARLDHIRPVLPSQIVLTVGLYAFKAMKDSKRFVGDNTSTLLHILHRKEVDLKTIDVDTNSDKIIVLDTVSDPHYWFDLNTHLEENGSLINFLKKRVFSYHQEVVTVGSLSEGVTSGVLPTLSSYLIQEEKSVVMLTVFPSMRHSSDALFNAFSSLGLLLLNEARPIILLDHFYLEAFIGVNKAGGLLVGGDAVNYLAELFLNKKGLIQDLVKLSKSFNVDLFTVLMALGASLEIYGNLRNILDITLEQPLLDFDLSTASMIYVIIKVPLRLKDQLPKGYIELEVNNWLKERANLDAPQICEPIYVEEFGNRIDLVVLVGGFNTEQLFKTINKRISRLSRLIVDQGLYDKEIWRKIENRLVQSQ